MPFNAAMDPRVRAGWLAGLLLGPLGCAGGPPVSQDPKELLAEAQALIDNGRPEAAVAVLETREADELPAELQPRYRLLYGRALLATGEAWEAYKAIETFADKHPHSELRSGVVELEYEIGRYLSRSGGGFLFFSSDRVASRTVLEHLITRYPDNPYLADALRILGEMAFEDGDYELAQARFLELWKSRPESEWVPLARFRYAMCLYHTLQGPAYDLDLMQRTARELEDFLSEPPENPEFVAEAKAALGVVRQWQAERHLLIADFYRDIGNRPGERYHLELAARDFAETEGGKRAKELLAGLPPPEGTPLPLTGGGR